MTLDAIRIVCICFTLCAWTTVAISEGRHPDANVPCAQDANTAKQHISNRGTAQQYYLARSSDEYGERAWLLSLDTVTRTGWLYIPPRLVPLQVVGKDASAALHLRTETVWGNRYFTFQGAVGPFAICGDIDEVETSTDVVRRTFVIQGGNVSQAIVSRKSPTLVGSYANVQFHEDSGDLTGVELLLFSDRTPVQGMITFYESYWGEPTMVPYVVTDGERVRSQVRFTVKTGNQSIRYSVIFRNGGAELTRHDMNNNPHGTHITLTKGKGVLPVDSLRRSELK